MPDLDTTTTRAPWPRCSKCGAPYSLTIGLPVTVTPTTFDAALVELDIDTGEITDLDDSCSISCNCDTEPADDVVEALAPWLLDVGRAAQKVSGVCVNLRDVS